MRRLQHVQENHSERCRESGDCVIILRRVLGKEFRGRYLDSAGSSTLLSPSRLDVSKREGLYTFVVLMTDRNYVI
jgi:hypothetical protein